MKEVVINKFGSSDILEYVEVERPKTTADQVLVEVCASSVNPLDYKIRRGELKLLTGKKFPKSLGIDIAGKAVEIGKNVTGFKAGDEVYGTVNLMKGGAYAEFAAANATELYFKPKNVNYVDAASSAAAGLTALQSLTKLGNIKKDDRLLINGCSGGVGSFAVQIAKLFDTHVTGVCSTKHVDFSKQLGVDKVIDYKKENILHIEDQYDIFFDLVENHAYSKIKKLLAPNGIYIGAIPNPNLFMRQALGFLFGKKKVKVAFLKTNVNDLKYLTSLLEDNKIKPVINKSFALKNIKEAHDYCENHSFNGKVGLIIKE